MVNSTMAVIFPCVSSQQMHPAVPRLRLPRGGQRSIETERAEATVLDPQSWIQHPKKFGQRQQVARQMRRSRSHGGKGGSGLSSNHRGKGGSGRRNNGGKGTSEGSEKCQMAAVAASCFFFCTSRYQKMTMCGRKETVACAQTMFFFAIPRFPHEKINLGTKKEVCAAHLNFRLRCATHTSCKRAIVHL